MQGGWTFMDLTGGASAGGSQITIQQHQSACQHVCVCSRSFSWPTPHLKWGSSLFICMPYRSNRCAICSDCIKRKSDTRPIPSHHIPRISPYASTAVSVKTRIHYHCFKNPADFSVHNQPTQVGYHLFMAHINHTMSVFVYMHSQHALQFARMVAKCFVG